ncbi:hypothetical protein AB0K81_28625 [Streptomyces werraensis]|uniref:Uncharacterized protein n=1 Tax=Streptomyces werraensis TaxID=68284 RepID=A0ABV3J8R6_9ACTN
MIRHLIGRRPWFAADQAVVFGDVAAETMDPHEVDAQLAGHRRGKSVVNRAEVCLVLIGEESFSYRGEFLRRSRCGLLEQADDSQGLRVGVVRAPL